MLIHDILKIKYVRLGYIIKNYPYHLISDEEMFNAFIDLGNKQFNKTTVMIDPGTRFFDDYYPNPFTEEDVYEQTKRDEETGKIIVINSINLSGEYDKLKKYIIDSINEYLAYVGTPTEADHQIPAWIYTYMLGETVYEKSDYLDIEDTLELLGCSNLDNEFTKEACVACYATSLNYVSRMTVNTRPPTAFGEPHVIKQLRMA